MQLGIYMNAQHPAGDDPARRFAETVEQVRLILVNREKHPRDTVGKIDAHFPEVLIQLRDQGIPTGQPNCYRADIVAYGLASLIVQPLQPVTNRLTALGGTEEADRELGLRHKHSVSQ